MRKRFAIVGVGALALGLGACATTVDQTGAPVLGAAVDGPESPRPGACYGKVVKPAQYRTEFETVLDEPAGKRLKVVPAVYRTVQERVLVQEAGFKEIEVPATYKTVTEEIVVRPAFEKLEVTPPVFSHRREEIIVDEKIDSSDFKPQTFVKREEHTIYKRPDEIKPDDRIIAEMPDGRKLVVDPNVRVVKTRPRGPRKKVIYKKVLIQPERTRRVTVPAKTRTVTRRVIDTPATIQKVPVDAEYKVIERRQLVTPEKRVLVDQPATFRQVPVDVLIQEAHVGWAEVLCETETSSDTVRAVQDALFSEGYYSGPIDGSFSFGLRNAVRAYQEDNNLATGALTLETIRSLGISA